MNVVFITPASDLRRYPIYRLGGKFYGQSNSITGPLILGHILKAAGHNVSVYEELNSNVDYRKLRDTDVFCISTMTSTAPRAYFLAEKLRRETGARILIGGMHASALPEEAAQYADQVIVGEGESVILDVVEGRVTDKIVHAPYIENLDDIPFPDYSLLRTPCKCANVMSTRGCPFCCTFCTTSRMFHPYRERSIASVIEELRYYKRLSFRYMNFEDDNFTANQERAKEICRRMIRENLVFKETFFFGRTDLATDEELVDLCQRAHLTRVLVGIESLNQASLDAVNKHQNIVDIERCAEVLARHKIRLIASLVLGIDTDSQADIKYSVDFAKKIHAYQLQPAVLTPYPGTEVYRQFQGENRLLTKEWSCFDMMNVTFLPEQMTPWELQKLFYSAVGNFYSFFSSFSIGRIFGLNYGLRRVGLSLMSKIGIPAAYLASLTAKNSNLYKLRHFDAGSRQ